MSSKMKRFFSTSQKANAQPYLMDGGGLSSGNMNGGAGNPVPSMADLSMRSGQSNGTGRSRTPPPPPIFAGYVGAPGAGGFGGPGGFGAPGGDSHIFAPPNGMLPPLHSQQQGQQLQQNQFPPPGAFYNGVDVANPPPVSNGSMNGVVGSGPPYRNSVGGSSFNGGGSINGGSINGGSSVNGHQSSYSGEISFLNALPPPPAETTNGLASPVGSVNSIHSDPNTNNIPPPPRSAGAQSNGSSQPPFPTPPPQYSQPQQQHAPQHQPSYPNMYQQQQQQHQQFSTGSAPFPPRQQPQPPPQQHQAPPPPVQQQQQAPVKTHRSLLGGKSKGAAAVVSPVAPTPQVVQPTYQPQQTQQQHPSTLQRQQPPPQSSQMTTQQHAMSNVDVTPADIRDTTYMLRELYKMELAIHGERYAIHEDDQSHRKEMRRKADLLREEIENNVTTWRTTAGAHWTREELQHVEYSVQLIGTLRSLGQGDSA